MSISHYAKRKGDTLLTLVFGSAFEVPTDDPLVTEPANVRVYRADGRTFIGHDSWEIQHVCNEECEGRYMASIESYLDRWTLNSEGRYYVAVHDGKEHGGYSYFPTIDVVDFDRGDDPLVHCAACDAELYRNDEEYLAQYGTYPRDPADDIADDSQGTLL